MATQRSTQRLDDRWQPMDARRWKLRSVLVATARFQLSGQNPSNWIELDDRLY
jgi:hypothetical protein